MAARCRDRSRRPPMQRPATRSKAAPLPPSDLDAGVEHDHVTHRHAEELGGVTAAPLHAREESSLETLPARQRAREHEMLTDEERAVLQVDAQTTGAARSQRLAHVRRLHEAEACGQRINAGQQLVDAGAVRLTLPWRAHDLDVEDQDA